MRRGEKRRLGIIGEAQAHRHGAMRRKLGDHEAGEFWRGFGADKSPLDLQAAVVIHANEEPRAGVS
jgi:hypothetical protein